VTKPPRTLAIVDAGGATLSVALVGHLDGRWRLLGSLAGPAAIDEDALLAAIAERTASADPVLAAGLGLDAGSRADVPRLTARSRPPGKLLVVGATERSLGLLMAEASRTSWHLISASPETHDPREMTELALDGTVDAVLLGAGDPPGPDERGALDDLAALGVAAARRRPDLRFVLCGGIRDRRAWRAARADDLDESRIVEVPAVAGRRGEEGLLRAALEGLRADPLDGRGAMRRSVASLADLLDRRVELIEVGFDGGTRILAEPGTGGGDSTTESVITAEGGLIPPEPGDDIIDGVLAWSTGNLDRHRLIDRLRELRIRPWADAAGDGARLRLAAASAALARMAAVTEHLGSRPAPDLTIVAGGAFAGAPASAIALAVAGTIRRPGATQLAWDHARLLGPIGTIDDPAERYALLADLARDALVPLGTTFVAAASGSRQGLGRHGRGSVGRVDLAGDGLSMSRELAGDEVHFMDLPPGAVARARFEFHDAVRLGRRTRSAEVEVTGGLAGLLVDLRAVPLRLPERRDRRRTMLAAWSELSWPGDDR